MSGNLIDIFNSATFLVQLILILLFILSVISWGLMIERLLFHINVSKEFNVFKTKLNNTDSITDFFRKIKYENLNSIHFFYGWTQNLSISNLKDNKKKFLNQMENSVNTSVEQLYNRLEYLSMIVTIAPFLGLLGTVWGIMHAFVEISASGHASLAVVAPGIAEALTTTIAGLIVAIPASIFFSIFNRKAKQKEASIINSYNSIESLF